MVQQKVKYTDTERTGTSRRNDFRREDGAAWLHFPIWRQL